MKKYNLINNLGGWLCFVIAATTYLLTIEPTASFWDCPEFIAQGTKLEVGHPPGNPIFMLTARFAVTLAGGEPSVAAVAVNAMSALLSAATILLLFWSITHLARRLMVRDGAVPGRFQTAAIMLSGLCGALAYTWSDTFWFSAVEGEVYAFSSFCTALVIWLMFKWENRADHPWSDRYLILIAYIIGVSIAVHLLNLLCIPALGLIFYYRKSEKVTAWGSLLALGVSVVIMAAILYGLVPGFVQVAQWFELGWVNVLHMPYNSGVLAYAIILIATFVGAIMALRRGIGTGARLLSLAAIVLSGMPFVMHSVWLGILISGGIAVLIFATRWFNRRVLSVIVLSVMVIFVGYSSYALLLIRAGANTPMNQNNPDNVFALASYLNREQYGDRPLLTGPSFAEALVEIEYPEGSGMYYVPIDENGLPQTKILDGYLRDDYNGAINTPSKIYTKVSKADPSEPDHYVLEVERPEYKTMPDLNTLFPRVYSGDPSHVAGYKGWSAYRIGDFDNIPATTRNRWAQMQYIPKAELIPYLPNLENVATNVSSVDGRPVRYASAYVPGFGDNMRYFVNYQINHMYWRYFMWNFAGRQNDIQGNGEPHLGNWISGIPFIDNARLGDQSLLPEEYGTANKGHNVFYMLPLILGLIGLLSQALYRRWNNPERGIEQFWVVFFLFFMTGLAIVLYLNQTPGQPRERDYAFAGSFYAYAMWIGLGVAAIATMVRNALKGKGRIPAFAATAAAAVVALGVPLQMVSQTWDDHDRSGRTTTRDFGFNYLSSLDPGAIIFTNGDNDTFPLWYAQEVEGYRTDVRVVNLSYLTTDWYADQLTLPTYEALPVPMYATPRDWRYERLAYSFVLPDTTAGTPVADALRELYASDTSWLGAHYMTHSKIKIPFDSTAAMARYATGLPEADTLLAVQLSNPIASDLSLLGQGMNQSKVLSLDIVANSLADGWQRPVYFATTVPTSYYLGLSKYMAPVGMAYEMTPTANPANTAAPQSAYAKIVGQYRWGGLDQPGAENLYLDETVRRMVSSVRSGVFSVAEDLMKYPNRPAGAQARNAAKAAGLSEPQTQADMARQLMDLIREKLPSDVAPYDSMMGLYMANVYIDLYLHSGNPADLETARVLADAEIPRYASLVRYAVNLPPYEYSALGRSETLALGYLGEDIAILNRINLLAALAMSDLSPEEKDAATDLLADFSIEDAWIIAPMLYIHGYTAPSLMAEIDRYHPDDQVIIRRAAALANLHSRLGVDQMELSRRTMADFAFSPEQWAEVHRSY